MSKAHVGRERLHFTLGYFWKLRSFRKQEIKLTLFICIVIPVFYRTVWRIVLKN